MDQIFADLISNDRSTERRGWISSPSDKTQMEAFWAALTALSIDQKQADAIFAGIRLIQRIIQDSISKNKKNSSANWAFIMEGNDRNGYSIQLIDEKSENTIHMQMDVDGFCYGGLLVTQKLPDTISYELVQFEQRDKDWYLVKLRDNAQVEFLLHWKQDDIPPWKKASDRWEKILPELFGSLSSYAPFLNKASRADSTQLTENRKSEVDVSLSLTCPNCGTVLNAETRSCSHCKKPFNLPRSNTSVNGQLVVWPEGQTIQFGENLTIGRNTDNILCLNDPKILQHHVVIEFVKNVWQIRNIRSTFEYIINGQHVKVPSVLKVGDDITLGDTRLTIENLSDQME